MNRFSSRRSAFSLIEILVVLGIAALIAALSLGGFSSFQGTQRRSTCQANMVQIYRACRLYYNDNDSYPPTYTVPGQSQLSGGLGLLWAHRSDSSSTGLKAPDTYTSYLKSPDALHCPADVGKDVPQTAINSQNEVALGFMSYQKVDAQGGDDSDGDVAALDKNQSYLPVRTRNTGALDYSRQLIHQDLTGASVNIPIPSNTVILWCPFHRGVSSKPDNVLFYDGSVKRMVIVQDANCLAGRPAAPGWHRLSECSTSTAANNEGAALAQP